MTIDKTTNKSASQAPGKGTGFLNVVKSAVSAAFGIQSQANRERDFKDGKPIHFIIAGIVTTLLFLGLVGIFVKIMITTNG